LIEYMYVISSYHPSRLLHDIIKEDKMTWTLVHSHCTFSLLTFLTDSRNQHHLTDKKIIIICCEKKVRTLCISKHRGQYNACTSTRTCPCMLQFKRRRKEKGERN